MKLAVLSLAIAQWLLTLLFPLLDLDSSLVENSVLSQLLFPHLAHLTVVFSQGEEAITSSFGLSLPVPECFSWLSLGNKSSSNEVYSPMKIRFRQSGGYAGLMMGYEINTESLSTEEAAQLHSLVEGSGILQAKSKRTANARDLFNYEITIETKESTHQVLFDDLSLSEAALPLVEYLQERAKPVSAD